MKRVITAGVAAAIAAAVVGGAFARPAMTNPKLKGTVGPGFSINLTMNGKKVKTLKPGKYTFVIADKASIHNFTLEREKGGKFEKDLTDVSFTGTKTVTLKLGKGTWKYYCTPHESVMFGFFKVK